MVEMSNGIMQTQLQLTQPWDIKSPHAKHITSSNLLWYTEIYNHMCRKCCMESHIQFIQFHFAWLMKLIQSSSSSSSWSIHWLNATENSNIQKIRIVTQYQKMRYHWTRYTSARTHTHTHAYIWQKWIGIYVICNIYRSRTTSSGTCNTQIQLATHDIHSILLFFDLDIWCLCCQCN